MLKDRAFWDDGSGERKGCSRQKVKGKTKDYLWEKDGISTKGSEPLIERELRRVLCSGTMVGDNKRLLWTSPRHRGNAKTARFRGTIKATSPSWIRGLVDDEGLGPPTHSV